MGVSRSTSSTSTIVPVSTSPGASVWKSTVGWEKLLPEASRALSTAGYLPNAAKVWPSAVIAGSVTWKIRCG